MGYFDIFNWPMSYVVLKCHLIHSIICLEEVKFLENCVTLCEIFVCKHTPIGVFSWRSFLYKKAS